MYPFDGYSMFNNPYSMQNMQNMQNQNFMNNYPAPQNTQQGGMEIINVQTIQQVEQVQIAPGQRKLIMVQNEPVVAVRVADNMGLASTEYYKLMKFDPFVNETDTHKDDSSKYVTEEQLEERLNKLVDNIKKEMRANVKSADGVNDGDVTQ